MEQGDLSVFVAPESVRQFRRDAGFVVHSFDGAHRELSARYGMRPDQIGQMVGLTFRGRRLPRFRTPDGEREMRLAIDEQQDRSIDDLANLPLYTDTGARVPLASVASEKGLVPAPNPRG